MSVEAQIIAALSTEGSLKKAFMADLTVDDFEIYDREYEWMFNRLERKEPITPFFFKRKFPEFDFILSEHPVNDLIEEFLRERAFVQVSSAIDELLGGEDPLDQDNVLEKLDAFQETVTQVRTTHVDPPVVEIGSTWEQAYQKARSLYLLRDNGEIPGIPTGLAHLDLHWGGLQAETTYVYLGRPGDAKSFSIAQLATEAAWNGFRVAVFSPEMSEWQHRCRFYTLLSAKSEVQEALGFRGPFLNRSLREGTGFNMKKFKRFLQWMDRELEGEIGLFTMKYRREKMTVPFIRSKLKDMQADLLVVDPVYKLKSPRRRLSRWEELGEITDGLVDIAHEFAIPVVLSNQANRALVGARDEAPSMNSSYGSDTPVQEADAVIGVRSFPEDKTLKYSCTKNRYGERFKFTARFYPNHGLLEDITPVSNEYTHGFDSDKLEQLEAQLEADERENDTYS